MAGKHVNPSCAPKNKKQSADGKVRKSGLMIAALLLIIFAFGIGYAVFTSASAATVASGKCGGSAEWALTKDGTLTISGTGAMEDYDYTNRPEWDDHKDLIKAVKISDGITNIGSDAFDSCKALAEVTMPDTVTSIGSAFCYCEKLTEITIPDGVTDIDGAAFFDCRTLMDINVSRGNEAYCSIDGIVFNKSGSELIRFPSGRTGSYTVPDSVTSICDYAFNGCTGLTEITIPDSVTSIGDMAFNVCTGLTKITIPDSVTSIGERALSLCPSLTEITLSDSVTSIDDYTFWNCQSLTSITIPDSVTSIGDYAFDNCISLAEITIPVSVTSIGSFAFDNCDELSDVYYGGSESDWQKIEIEIENYGNISLLNANIHYNSAMPAQGAEPASAPAQNPAATIASGKCGGSAEWVLTEDGTLTISVTGAIEDRDYSINPMWDYFRDMIKTVIISDGITNIGDRAFCYCSALTEITIPDSVTNTGYDAFRGCTALAEITIPDSLTSIGDSAFSDCDSLTDIDVSQGNEAYCSIDGVLFNKSGSELICFPAGRSGSYMIPDSVTSICNSAFSGCTGLTEITIPNGVTSICDYAFNGCTGLTEITIPDGITSIGSSAFNGCTALADITIPNGVTSIGYGAFSDCTALAEITIPDSLTSIGNSAFSYCDSLTDIDVSQGNEAYYSIDGVLFNKSGSELICFPAGRSGSYMIPDSVTSICDYAFSGCTALADITIPDGVTSICDYTFSGCTALAEITIPDSLTSIGNSAFSGCTALAEITIPDSLTSIGNSAFSGCTSLADITIPVSVTSIGDWTFYGCASLADITIPVSVTSIGDWTFYGCASLADITIPVSVTSIGSSAFSGCTGLTEITIPVSVTSIGDYAFFLCDMLSDVYYEGSGSDWQKIEIEIDYYSNSSLTNAKIHYNSAMPAQGAEPASAPAQNPAATVASGKCGGSAEWALTDDGTLTISGTGAMEDYAPATPEWYDHKDMIKTVRISDGVTSIGDSAFSGCLALTDITIPDSLTNIGIIPFFGCDSLVNIYVGQGNEVYSSIDGVLFNKTASELVYFPEGRTGSYTIPVSVTSIAADAFNCCSRLTEIFIPASVTSIGDAAFLCCDKLSDVYYEGSESDWQKIESGFLPSGLENANIHYNASA